MRDPKLNGKLYRITRLRGLHGLRGSRGLRGEPVKRVTTKPKDSIDH